MSASEAMGARTVWYSRSVGDRATDDDFATLVLANADSMFGLARHLTGNSTAAEELVQETYARALAGQKGFARGTNLKAWLLRILRNTFLDDLRRRRGDPTMRGLSEDDIEARPETSGAPLRGDAELDRLRGLVARDIELAMSELAEASRTVILLDVEGLSESEIADVLECAPGTVKSRLFRARAALRERLSEYAR